MAFRPGSRHSPPTAQNPFRAHTKCLHPCRCVTYAVHQNSKQVYLHLSSYATTGIFKISRQFLSLQNENKINGALFSYRILLRNKGQPE